MQNSISGSHPMAMPGVGRDVAVSKDRDGASPDPILWQNLLWLRDQAAVGRRALIIGDGAALAAILLARSDMTVHGLESDSDRITEAQDRLAGQDAELAPTVKLDRLDGKTLGKLNLGDYDVAAISSGYDGDLGRLMGLLTANPNITRIVLAMPFGYRAGNGVVLPRALYGMSGGLGLELLEVVSGQIRAVFSSELERGAESPDEELLRLTEAGASQELNRLSRKVAELEFQYAEVRSNWMVADRDAKDLRASTSFKVGYALVNALRSPRTLPGLPLNIFRILRERDHREIEALPEAERNGLTEWEKEALRGRVAKVLDSGLGAIKSEVSRFMPNAGTAQLAFGYLIAAQACARLGRHDLEFDLASSGLDMNRSVGMLRGFLHVALRARRMEAACLVLDELQGHANRGNKLANEFLQGFKQTSSYKIAVLSEIPQRIERQSPKKGGRLVYVLHNSLPYSSGGYATRSHGVASGLANRGRDVVCVTRPGFPLDMKPDLAPIDMPIVDRLGDVLYQRVLEPRRPNIPEYQYVIRAMNSMEDELRRLTPSFVQAASNYVTGLPALVAARRLGVPFFYEVRGLWEITRMSRDQKFAESISFDIQRHIESTLAQEADHVFTLTEPMREELILRGVDPAKITLLPNSVDAERFHARERDESLAASLGIPPGVPVIGYVGTFVVYEGLEDLAAACVELHRRGQDFRLLLVGNENASGTDRGPIAEEILRIAKEGGIESKILMPGRIPHEQVEAYYSLIDVCPFPRKPWPVCEMVSPMKPLEAMAMKKPVIVSSVRALTEMVAHDNTGMVFEKGSVQSLADTIAALIADPDKRRRLGEAARIWVEKERSWNQVADRIQEVMARFEDAADNGMLKSVAGPGLATIGSASLQDASDLER